MDVRADGGNAIESAGEEDRASGRRRRSRLLRRFATSALYDARRGFYVKSSRKPWLAASHARSLVRRGGVDRPTFTS